MLRHLKLAAVVHQSRDGVQLNGARDAERGSLHDCVVSRLDNRVDHLLVVHVGALQVRINGNHIDLFRLVLLLHDHVIIDTCTCHTVENDGAANGSTKLEHD